MKTKYISEDGSEFESKRMCNLYEESKNELEYIKDHKLSLQYKRIGEHRFFKINSYAELWLYDEMIAKKRNEKPQTLYEVFSNMETRFPVWLRDDAKASKKSMIDDMNKEINKLKGRISELRDYIKGLKKLDSRSKSQIIESHDVKVDDVKINEEIEVEVEEND